MPSSTMSTPRFGAPVVANPYIYMESRSTCSWMNEPIWRNGSSFKNAQIMLTDFVVASAYLSNIRELFWALSYQLCRWMSFEYCDIQPKATENLYRQCTSAAFITTYLSSVENFAIASQKCGPAASVSGLQPTIGSLRIQYRTCAWCPCIKYMVCLSIAEIAPQLDFSFQSYSTGTFFAYYQEIFSICQWYWSAGRCTGDEPR